MKRNTLIFAGIALFVSIAAVTAFAHGPGWGRVGSWGHHGQGWHHRGDYGQRYDDQMTKEEYKQWEQQREAFFTETQDMRANLYERELELQNELAKSEPDASKASGLQKEISELHSKLDQKRIDHMIEMRKLNPNAGSGFIAGGPMMGSGPRGGGYCW
jgi:Spy/CpxP family protein refolding chaperone